MGIIRGAIPTHPESIAWHDWGAAAFAVADAEQKPVLLAIGAAWCRWTADMDRVSYRDPRVVGLVAARFVPVRVDADRRPDVAERYTLDGWPTTAFLTPAGDLLGGGTYLDADALAVVLGQVAEAFAGRRAEIDQRVASTGRELGAAPPRPDPTETRLDEDAGRWLDDELLTRFDPTWAGFGVGPKRVDADALGAALVRCRETKDPDLAQVVTRTLDAMAGRGLWDPVAGGFFRGCAERDWSVPERAKILTVNARLLELYLSASRLFERADYADCARAIIQFVHGTFADPEGGFFASQRGSSADDEGPSSPEAGRHRSSAPIDRTIYTDATAVMGSAYVLGASVLKDESLLEFAASSVDRVVMATYERGGGVGHDATGAQTPRGLLTDHVAASAALLDLHDATGQPVYLDMPRELMAFCQQTMWDPARGFSDRAPDLSGLDAPIGLLREAHYPLDLNCRAAIVLARLGARADEPAYGEQALQTLARQTPVYRAHGLGGAAYLLALDRLTGDTPGEDGSDQGP